mmetsp:Transcript_13671/g.23443  ORF Transcript_13671/g.23443 Transcript_13671/m.23443 type:complete len:265 (-) Transcript_13671:1069-1863(-)|eukprot:CAMPEP_0196661104 /NCGR_PEP_ID=MMETSP1086-20130531/42686_1 /TAXON_ID=77921 /ORGANISM="Cyanoptyche  gloeocystis , Strain SAG4.97" /LENGTH=264 /DNA_ID=CAMNT_0041995855 /DNA_START=278 /DNA_END=1072 /DNA_ORIENTATION=+
MTVHNQQEPVNAVHLTTPWWFGNEDSDQIAKVFEIFSNELDIPLEKDRRSRAPLMFIGSIKRLEVQGPNMFTTLDEVRIYSREHVQVGSVMPLEKKVYTLTAWDALDGLPVRVFQIPRKETFEFWSAKSTSHNPSCLYRLPVIGRENEFCHKVLPLTYEVTYTETFYSVLLHAKEPFQPCKGNVLLDLQAGKNPWACTEANTDSDSDSDSNLDDQEEESDSDEDCDSEEECDTSSCGRDSLWAAVFGQESAHTRIMESHCVSVN